MKRRAFTLVELLIVIIIVAVLAAIAIPKFTNSTRRAHEAHLKAKLKFIREGVERFHAETGFYPNNLAQLTRTLAPATVLDSSGSSVSFPTGLQWNGPYIDRSTAGVDANGTDLVDPVCGGTFSYTRNGAQIGRVRPCATGTALDGSNIAAW